MSNDEALDDKIVQALAERLGWRNYEDHSFMLPDPEDLKLDLDCVAWRETTTREWHLTLAGVAACIEGLGLDVHCDGDSLFRCVKFPLTEGPTAPFCSTLTAAATAAVTEIMRQ